MGAIERLITSLFGRLEQRLDALVERLGQRVRYGGMPVRRGTASAAGGSGGGMTGPAWASAAPAALYLPSRDERELIARVLDYLQHGGYETAALPPIVLSDEPPPLFIRYPELSVTTNRSRACDERSRRSP